MLKFNFINRLYLTFILYLFNFDLSFPQKPVFLRATAAAKFEMAFAAVIHN